MLRVRSLPLPAAIGTSAGLALAIALIVHGTLPDWRWYQPLFHSVIEALGGLCAIVLALVLFKKDNDPPDVNSLPLAIGFLSMGVLEEFHAVSESGNAFIALRGLASLSGALGFALAWLPSSQRGVPRVGWLPWAGFGTAVGLGAFVLTCPDCVPDMIRNGEFAPAAIVPTTVASLLFLLSAVRFWRGYRRANTSEAYLFACLALVFGLAECMFTFSSLWDVRWWFWHLLRLLGYSLVLVFMVNGYQRMLVDLRLSLAQTRKAEESARGSQLHLRQVLEDREGMAQDLHDGIIQSLFALTLNLERCQRLARTQADEAIEQLGLAVASVKTVIRDLRGFIGGLRPEIADGCGLAEALATQVKSIQAVSDLKVSMRLDPAAAQLLAPEQAMHVLNIAREALSNALRHAKAHTVSLVLEREPTGVRLMVEDDGIGIQAGAPQEGEGLKNMAARAARLHANMHVSSEPGRGTRITCELPMETVHV